MVALVLLLLLFAGGLVDAVSSFGGSLFQFLNFGVFTVLDPSRALLVLFELSWGQKCPF